MQIIQLDGRNWKTPLDFIAALREGIDQDPATGWSVDAFIDSMIWRGMGGLEPPYVVQIVNIRGAPRAVIDEVMVLSSAIRDARLERLNREGTDVDVSVSCPELET